MSHKKNQNIFLLTTVYPGVENYFNDFVKSVNSQDYKNFELVIVNDNFTNLDKYLPKLRFNKIHIFCSKKSPEKNRIYGIKKCIDLNADIIIFADSDDAFSKNRISETIRYFDDANLDVLINDINVCDSKMNQLKENYISERIKHHSSVTQNSIRHFNFCGLSNSAIKADVCNIDEIIAINPFDWSFFTMLFLKGAKAIFTNKIKTLYRQHNENFVGIGHNLNDDRIMKAIEVKLNHYKKINSIFREFDDLIDFYESVLSMNKKELNSYKQKCFKEYKDNSLWWEEVMNWS
tara:strand:- start:119 stop:991 length:873 start_codon:yes stop_codon:yes gene_type:complete